MNSPPFRAWVRIVLAAAPLLLIPPALPQQRTEEQEKQSEQIAETVTTSVTEAIQGQSGISVQTMCTNCNSADLSIGAFGVHFISMVSGKLPVPSGLPQIYLLSVLPGTAIDNIAVEKGSGRAKLEGGAIGGEIDLQRRKPAKGLQANATVDAGSFGWRGARAGLSGRTGWFGGSVIGTWATSDLVDADSDGNPDMASFDRSTWDARIDLEPGRHEIEIGAMGYKEKQDDGRAGYDFLDSEPESDLFLWNLERVDITLDQYDGSYRYDFADGSNVTASWISSERLTLIENTATRKSEIFIRTYDINEQYEQASVTWFRPLSHRIVLRVGASQRNEDYSVIDYVFNDLKSSVAPDLPKDFQLQESPSETGVWAEGEFSFGGDINLFAGIRYAEYDYTDNTALVVDLGAQSASWLDYELPTGSKWLPRFALAWKPVDRLNLRFTYGEGYRQPPATFEEVCCGRRYRGNRGIRMEESRVYGIEATYQPTPETQLNVSVFRTDFEDLIVKAAGWIAFEYQPTYQNVNVPEARYGSLAVEFKWDALGWLMLRAGGSWTDPDNRTEGDLIDVLVGLPNGTPKQFFVVSPEVPYVPERTGNLALQFRERNSRIVVDLSAQFAGPQLIQRFPKSGVASEFIDTPSFNIFNIKVSKPFKSFDAFVGLDNFTGYYQTDLRDPRTDYTWGPLRGAYLYAGVSYRFAGL